MESSDEQMEVLLESKLADFKKQLSQINEDALSKLYTDVLPYILSDTQFNMVQAIDVCLEKVIKGDFKVITDNHNNYVINVTDHNGFEHTLRESNTSIWGTLVKKIFEANPEALKDAYVQQLQARITSLEAEVMRAYRR